MKPRRLFELLVVYPFLTVAFFLLVIVAATPWTGGRLRASETSAIATLRNLHSAQRMFVAALAVDLDEDGIGEFGTLGELTGVDPLRGYPSQVHLEPPVVSPGLRPTGVHGTARRSGYLFRLYLPGPDGSWLRVDEDPNKRTADESEVRWCVFAWPAHHDAETTRTFRVDQTGRVTATEVKVDPSALPRRDLSDWVEVR